MKTIEFLKVFNEMPEPLFFAGLGMAMVGLVVFGAYLAHQLRNAGAAGVISKGVAEVLCMVLVIPGIGAIFAIVSVIRLVRVHGIEDEYWAFVISGLVWTAVIIYLNAKDFSGLAARTPQLKKPAISKRHRPREGGDP